jgi:hypothetical protein
MMVATAFGLVALLTVGRAAALAHGGGRGGGGGSGRGGGAKSGAISASLVAAAAKELGVPPAVLRTAIGNSAKAEIDETVADGDAGA